MSSESSTVASRALATWRMRLDSALRAALACASIGLATIYGPKLVAKEIKFAAFSYLTAVLIVYDATLGDALRGCWHAVCATAQVVPAAVLLRWAAAGAGVPVGVAALAAAAASFAVALPECTHVTAKRIALGQVVLVCTDAVLVGGGEGGGVEWRPAYVAASTGLGAVASVVAMLVPYPSLAGNKKGMQWERPLSRYLNPNSVGPADTLQMIELQMRGMEYSLSHSSILPVQTTNQEQLSNFLQDLSSRLKQRIKHLACFSPSRSTTESEIRKEFTEKPLVSSSLDHESSLFYFSCIDMLIKDPTNQFVTPREPHKNPRSPKTECTAFQKTKTWILNLSNKGRLESALKCSLSLGLALLFGLVFDRENGCWAGLTIAISFVMGRQPIFTMANARAQGTAIGSVYGVICCFLFHHEEFRLLALLPWIVLTSFMKHSRMYGPTGGVSAAIGALLILGRKHYGPPHEFAIARLAEVFIGLSALVTVELLVQPARAATLAKNRLFRSLSALHDCIKEMGICGRLDSKFIELGEKIKSFDTQVQELKKIVEEADLEPDFWYLPFRASCYRRIVESLDNIKDMLYFIACDFEILSEVAVCKDLHEQVNSELELFQEALRCSQVYLETANMTEFRANSKEGSDENFRDLEAGKETHELSVLSSKLEVAKRNREEAGNEDNEKLKEQMIQCLGATGFCAGKKQKETLLYNVAFKDFNLGHLLANSTTANLANSTSSASTLFKEHHRHERKSSATETIESTALPLKGVHNIHGRHGLPAGMLSVGDGIADDILQKDLQDTASLLVDEAADALDTAPPGQTADRRLRDALDVVPEHLTVALGSALAEALAALATSRHFSRISS
ncbi:p-hydroxybenzoic acid efflux pump subunit aaeB [Striga asiatica]|uniref:p-hydroxybenzoic acid efflux pump subunit aaeB n=1 Tax=Striga asiatica TaxID=4170 RepID=A0A5A7RJC7_STRAF|nr:p-hydroxybenzoic acid efflux pump subunit aaeB [Striga asiatica]